MTLDQNNRRFLFSLLCIATLLCGCNRGKPANNSGNDPKAQIYAHLARKSGQKQFTPGMDLNRTADAIARDEDPYIRSVREQMRALHNYEEFYRLVGQQLATADRLLAHTNIACRRTALNIAREACRHAMSDSIDNWLAARICETYFWPNLDIADAPGSQERALDMLLTSRRVFFDTYETNNVLTNYYLLLARAPDTHSADTFRVQVADWLEEKGDVKLADTILSEIKDPKVLALANDRITRVKERAIALR
jgi:hypothetical protein